MTTGLNGHRVLITGSSRGIGAATAREVHALGGRVVLHGRTESPPLLALARELDAEFIVADVGNRTAVDEAVRGLLERDPTLSALVNCAGQVTPKPFLAATDEDWLAEFRVNLLGVVHFCQAVAPAMQAAGYGRIVNVASIRGENATSSARGMAYSASKAAVSNFTATLAKELAPSVTVTAVSPGFIATDMSATWTDAVWQQAQTALVGRAGRAEDIAHLLAFLASEKSAFLTGQTFVADGGYTISGK